jgi:metal-dependent amidase/aminoacylase/carboxypeptidase family protein
MKHRTRSVVLSIVAAVLAAPLSAQRPTSAPLDPAIERALVRAESGLIALRRDIHQHPELSGAEARTAALVAERLRALGLEVRTGVGGHGVVALLRGGRPGPMVAYRADMDAVRDGSPDPVSFPSVVPGVRHICGHDVHTTIGLAIATGLAAARLELRGSVLFIFQPAEERATGAEAMLADGVFGDVRPVAIYAVHTSPGQVGRLATAAGGLMPGRDRLVVSISGPGNLRTVADSVRRILERAGTITPEQRFAAVASEFIMVETFPIRPTADGIQLGAEITLASAETRRALRARLERELTALGTGGVEVRMAYQEKSIAGVTNAPALVTQGNAAIAGVLGDSAVRLLSTVLPAFSEDFGSFQERVPGVMYFLGVSNAAQGTEGMPHTPNYVADEGAILIGARAMTAVLLARLREG